MTTSVFGVSLLLWSYPGTSSFTGQHCLNPHPSVPFKLSGWNSNTCCGLGAPDLSSTFKFLTCPLEVCNQNKLSYVFGACVLVFSPGTVHNWKLRVHFLLTLLYFTPLLNCIFHAFLVQSNILCVPVSIFLKNNKLEQGENT